MARPLDDLEVGMWVVVTDHYEEQHTFDAPIFHRPRGRSFSGIPIQIIAISPPFLSVQSGDEVSSIDTREWGVNRVTDKKYIEYMRNYAYKEIVQHNARVAKKRKHREKPDPRNCPRCGERLVTRLIKDGQKHGWQTYCQHCYLQGEFAPCE